MKRKASGLNGTRMDRCGVRAISNHPTKLGRGPTGTRMGKSGARLAWKMEFVPAGSHPYLHLSFVHPEYAQWYKKRIVKAFEKFGFDGFVFAEPFYPVYNGVNKDPVEFCDVSEGFQDRKSVV